MKKRGKITKRVLLSVFIVVLILAISISISVGLQIRSVLVEKYTEFAFTYVNAAAEYIDGDKIDGYYRTGNKDAYYEEIRNYLNSTANSSAEEANIRYFYVFVPDEEDYTYIWDAEPYEEPCDLLEHYPYSEGAKEQAIKIFNKEVSEDSRYYIDAENGIGTLTVSVPLLKSNGDVAAIIAADLSVIGINEAVFRILFGVISSVIGIMVITMVFYFFFTRKRIIRPIIKLNDATGAIIDNLETGKSVDIDVHTNDEIETLADSFSEMNEKLHDYIRQNVAITAEKERIGAELELAQRIQGDMLPNIFPAFPYRKDFDIYAMMIPAKEVGGDFYDFFLIDQSHLGVVMADVSGKGVPAALFMMMSKILIQNQAMSGKSPAQALEAANNQICSNNREEMFVTVWLGILDLNTGLLTAANAGHEKPVIKKPDGSFEQFMDRHGFVVGGMEGLKYKEYQIQLEKGSKLFIYTDGVVEATSEEDELFGMEHTLEALNSVKDESPDVILNTVKQAVDSYVGSAPQFDDLTMLCLEYKGAQNEITIDCEVPEIAKTTEMTARAVARLNFNEKEKNLIEIAVDEIVSNIVYYAYEGKQGTANVKIDTDDKGIIITITDSGIEYNPLEKEDPDITLSAEERGIGGYGIYIVKKVMDEITYERKDGKNILTLRKYFK